MHARRSALVLVSGEIDYLRVTHSLNKKLQGDLSAWFGSVPCVLEVCKGNALLGDDGCNRQGLGSFDKIAF